MPGMVNDVLLPNEVRQYIKQHKIDETVTGVLNNVLKEMPKDPLEHLVCQLGRHNASPPAFLALRRDAAAPAEELRFDVIVTVRGVRVRIHSLALGGHLFAPLPPGAGEAAPAPPERKAGEAESTKSLLAKKVRQQEEESRLFAFLEGFFAKAFGAVLVDGCLGFAEKCAGLAEAPCPGGYAVDLPKATAAVVQELVVAAARTLNSSLFEYMQLQLAKAGLPPGLRLRQPSDFAAWRTRWPRLALPVFHGGGPSVLRVKALRVCAALSPFAVGPAADPAGPAGADCPPPSWAAAAVRVLRQASTEALALLKADKTTAALAAEGVPYGHPLGLGKTLDLTQEALKRAGGGDLGAEACGVLVACAEDAWQEQEGVYELETGKKLSLEQLVDLYALLSESGWLRMIVQPFRPNDFAAGCDLLRARRPHLRLVADFGEEGPPREAPQGAAYSCAFRLAETMPLTLQRYAEIAPPWREAGGCGALLPLDARTAAIAPSALELAAVLGETEVVLLSPQVADADVARMSERFDELVADALYPGEDMGSG